MLKIIKIEDDITHKKLVILGIIKFSIKLKSSYLYKRTKQNYEDVIKKLRKEVNKRPLRVIFLVTEKQKWGYQSLYEKLKEDNSFEPIVVASCVTFKHENPELERCSVEDNIEFFKSLGIEAKSAYVNNEYVDLKEFSPDIIFYQQPWGIPEIHLPHRMSKYALCCYCSYSIATSMTGSMCIPLFFYCMWKYFLAHDCMKEEYETWMEYNTESLQVTGHPKLEVYKSYSESSFKQDKHYVIYAPHFSVGDSILRFATFDWSGQFMLDWAKAHPEFNWVFKPHPQLKSSFVEKEYMTEEEVNAYFNEWSKIGTVYENGDYFGIFKDSDAMITDCGSFCVEYFFTGKPLLHLIADNSAPHSLLNRLVNANHYSVYSKETLEKYLEEILIKKNDFLKDVRKKALYNIFPEQQNSATNIVNYLKKELGI